MSRRSFVPLLFFLLLLSACGDLENAGNVTQPDEPRPPEGAFGLSENYSGPFPGVDGPLDPTDERILEVEPGGKFYARVVYEGAGISDITVSLINPTPEGLAGPLDPSQSFFTLGEPTGVSEPSGNCELTGEENAVTCIYEIQVAEDAVNIDELEGTGDEFAYVFQPQATDAAGNTSEEDLRGYVVVRGEGGETPTPNPVPQDCANPVSIPDEALQAGIKDDLGLPEDAEITCEDLANLTEFNYNVGDSFLPTIDDLEGLQYAVNLKSFTLSNNSLTPEGLAPLKNLTSLETLRFSVEVANSDALSFLENLTNLEELAVEPASVPYEDDYEGPVLDLGVLQNLTELTSLRLFSFTLSDLSPLQSLTKLTELRLGGDGISDISVLQNLTNLEVLYLAGNAVSDLGPLQNLTALTELNLFGNAISDLSPLQSLTSLTELDLSRNVISDLSPLQNLTGLTSLNAGSNKVSDLAPLQNLVNLTSLALFDNEISDLSPLQSLTDLSSLSLSNNEIGDIGALVDNQGLMNGDEVSLNGNPLDTCPGSDAGNDIDTLIKRGVAVEFDEPESCETTDSVIRVTTDLPFANYEDDTSVCTLRDAITAANSDSAVAGCSAGSGADTIFIEIDASTFTLNEVDNDTDGPNGLPSITSDITIVGFANIYRDEEAPPFRIMHVAQTGRLTLRDIGLAFGSIDYLETGDVGGGGGLLNKGSATLIDGSVFRGSARDAGGIYNEGTLVLTRAFLNNNEAPSAAALRNAAGGSVTMRDTQVGFSDAEEGGVIANDGDMTVIRGNIGSNYSDTFVNSAAASLTLEDSDVGGNRDGGAALINEGEAELNRVNIAEIISSGEMRIVDSAIVRTDNTSLTNEGDMSVTNSTVSSASQTGEPTVLNRAGSLRFVNSTLAKARGEEGESAESTGILNESGTVTLAGTILARHSVNCEGPITSEGYNLDSDGSCDLDRDTDLSDTDPKFGALRYNFGDTPVYSLLAGSPAVDVIPTGDCAVETDQRGVSRPQGEACDIGAFELEQ